MEETIRILKVAPGQPPEETVIPNTLEASQQIVGGYIEVVGLDDDCVLVCNEEGKLLGLPGNRRCGEDIITGTFFVTACDEEGDFCSLSDDQMETFRQQFAEIQTFTQKDIDDAMVFRIWGY